MPASFLVLDLQSFIPKPTATPDHHHVYQTYSYYADRETDRQRDR